MSPEIGLPGRRSIGAVPLARAGASTVVKLLRRRWLLPAAGLIVSAVVVTTVLPAPPDVPRPSRESFEHVREGMTREEEAATIGAPPEVAATIKRDSGAREAWNSEDTHLSVRYGPDARVDQILIAPLPRKSLTQR